MRQTVVSGRRCTFPRLGRDNGPASCEEREITNEREGERGGESWYRTFCVEEEGGRELQSVPDSSLRSAVTTLQFPRKPILILAYMRVILSPPFIFSVYPFYFLRSSINPPSRPFILPVCIHSLSASVHPPSPSLFHPCGTYQRQGNLICSAVRRTLTELNVWFPFISVHLTNALPPPPFVSSIDFNRRISRGEKKKTVDSSISQRMVNFLSVSCYSPTL